jgi:hypothetical protein
MGGRAGALTLAAVVLSGACGGSGSAVVAPTRAPTTTVPPPLTTAAAPQPAAAAAPVAPPTGHLVQKGCPPPRRPPTRTPGPPKGLRVVPEDQVAEPLPPPASRGADVDVVAGSGVWIWQWDKTEGGDADRVVARARAVGLSTLWVRVGDSKRGFYGASVLERLVPRAHAAGIRVIGWGFPFLADPAADARWTADALHWTDGPARLDAFSADLETDTEGVTITGKRLASYLGEARQALDGRPLIATVYNPTDQQWGRYPYSTIAPYADAFAPMVYWGCRDPGEDANRAVQRLLSFHLPVVPTGQAYDMASDGGRHSNPSAEETVRFAVAARAAGATGIAWWDWQEASDEQWTAIAATAR